MSPERDERIKRAVNLGLANTAATFDPADRIPTEFLAELRDGVLMELHKVSVVPNYVKVEGVDYSYEGIDDIRSELVRLRDEAMKQNAFEWVLIVTHTIAMLHLLAEVIKETSDAG